MSSSTLATRFKQRGFSFCLPYNNQSDWLDRLCGDYADITHNVYMPLHPAVFPSLYLEWRGGDAGAYHEQFMAVHQRLASAGIRTNILLNSNIPACTRFDDLFAYFDRWLDTRWMMVSVMNFQLARQLRQRYPDVYITASLSASIENATAARWWKRDVNADCATLYFYANKRPDSIRSIRNTGMSVKMVVNNQCLPHCPTQHIHCQAIMLHGLEPETARQAARDMHAWCNGAKAAEPWIMAQNIVLPHDLPRYEGLVDVMKIEGRNRSTDNLTAIVESYLAMEDRISPDFGYQEPADAFDHISACDRVCDACGWCAKNITPIAEGYNLDRIHRAQESARGETMVHRQRGQRSGPVHEHIIATTREFLQPYIQDGKPLAGTWEYEGHSVWNSEAVRFRFRHTTQPRSFAFVVEPDRDDGHPSLGAIGDFRLWYDDSEPPQPNLRERKILRHVCQRILTLKGGEFRG